MSHEIVRPTEFTPPEANPAEHPPILGLATHNHRCQFCFADGRRCAMLRWRKHRAYCLAHAREEERLLAADQVGRELTSLSGEFNTVSDINHVLGKVFTLLAHNRIDRRDAVAYAYVGQLLLQTIPTVKDEVCEVFGRPAWKKRLQDALCEPPDVTQVDAQADEPDVTQIDAQADEQPEAQTDAQTEPPHKILQSAEFAPAAEGPATIARVFPTVPLAEDPRPSLAPAPTTPAAEARAPEKCASTEPTPPITDAQAAATESAAQAPTAKRIRPRPQPPQTFYTDERGARIPTVPRS